MLEVDCNLRGLEKECTRCNRCETYIWWLGRWSKWGNPRCSFWCLKPAAVQFAEDLKQLNVDLGKHLAFC